MPKSAPTPCRHPGCSALVEGGGYCAAHRKNTHSRYYMSRRERPDLDDGFYHRKTWKDVRSGFLREHPLCEHCRREGRMVPAEVVDHIQPRRRGGEDYDHANLQALCKSCHARKSLEEREGGS